MNVIVSWVKVICFCGFGNNLLAIYIFVVLQDTFHPIFYLIFHPSFKVVYIPQNIKISSGFLDKIVLMKKKNNQNDTIFYPIFKFIKILNIRMETDSTWWLSISMEVKDINSYDFHCIRENKRTVRGVSFWRKHIILKHLKRKKNCVFFHIPP